jgi:hypothetical protein
MRWLILLGVFLLTPATGQARDYCKGDLCFQSKARTSCLKPQVWSILRTVAARVGPLEVTSGCDGRHARRSHHYSGRAVDFRPMRAPARSAIACCVRCRRLGRGVLQRWSRSCRHRRAAPLLAWSAQIHPLR